VNAQLTTGGMQQQLQQQQLNSPYQQQLAQAAFPYQQAQFNAGITGALAPALGGTTTGTATTNSQFNPSLMGQIGGGLAAVGQIARISRPDLAPSQAEAEYGRNKRRMIAMKASGEIQS
jgi:hypothetical protein